MKFFLKILTLFIMVIFIIIILFKVRIKDVEVVGSERQEGIKVTEQIFKTDNDRISILFLIKNLLGIKSDVQYVDTYKVEWITPFSVKIEVFEKPFVGYVKRDIVNVYFDKEGIISELTDAKVKGVPEVRGINFWQFEKGRKLQVEEEEILEVLLNLINSLREVDFDVSLIEFDKTEKICVYIGKICVELGHKDNIDVKIGRLIDIYPKIKELSGSLDLSEARENMSDEQYIFKKS